MRAFFPILCGAQLLGCDLASGLDAFHLRNDSPDQVTPCLDVPSDDFSRGIGGQWIVAGTANVETDGSRLVISAAPGEEGSLESRVGFDFAGCQAHLEVVAPPAVEGEASFLLSVSGGYVGFVTAEDGTIRIGMSAEPTLPGEATTVPASTPWWRMRSAGEDLVFETSSDGSTWTFRRRISAPSLNDATLIIAGQARGGALGEVVASFDNLNTH
jgi:hypothetical protein